MLGWFQAIQSLPPPQPTSPLHTPNTPHWDTSPSQTLPVTACCTPWLPRAGSRDIGHGLTNPLSSDSRFPLPQPACIIHIPRGTPHTGTGLYTWKIYRTPIIGKMSPMPESWLSACCAAHFEFWGIMYGCYEYLNLHIGVIKVKVKALRALMFATLYS